MTIAEYIRELQKLPQDATVVRKEYEYVEGEWTAEKIKPRDILAGFDAHALILTVNDEY